MNDILLKLDERTLTGKKAARLRKDGMIPSVVYGAHNTAMITQSPAMTTTKVVYTAGKHTPVHLMIGSKKKLAIIKNIDIDPVRHKVRHVAFHTIKQNETITTEVPILLSGMGESLAEKAGLVVLQTIEKIEVKATPAHLPDVIEMSILELESPDDKLTLADITLPDGVEFANSEQDLALVVANTYEPGVLRAEMETSGGEAEEASAADVSADNGGDTTQDAQAEEVKPGGKNQDEPKQSNVDAHKK